MCSGHGGKIVGEGFRMRDDQRMYKAEDGSEVTYVLYIGATAIVITLQTHYGFRYKQSKELYM